MAKRKGHLNEVQQEADVYLGVEAKDDFTDEIWRQRTAPVADHPYNDVEVQPANHQTAGHHQQCAHSQKPSDQAPSPASW